MLRRVEQEENNGMWQNNIMSAIPACERDDRRSLRLRLVGGEIGGWKKMRENKRK